MSTILIVREDLRLGVPLPWRICDSDGAELMPQGALIQTEEQLQALLARNPQRALADAPAAAASSAKSEVSFSFSDMKLKIGDKIQLQPPASVGKERYIVRLIGYVDNVDLLVSTPVVNGRRISLLENDQLVARFFSSEKIFGFSSTVERVCKLPYDYLHLSFPTEIQGSVIRKSPRVRINISTNISTLVSTQEASDHEQAAVIINLSAEGAFIRTRQPLCQKGEAIRLSFQADLHDVCNQLVLNGIVRNTVGEEGKNGEGTTTFDHGIQFQDLAPNDRVILRSLIYQQMIEQPNSLI
ncbi:MAG: flagellar brake protein [Rhodocyclaceae bacterium]